MLTQTNIPTSDSSLTPMPYDDFARQLQNLLTISPDRPLLWTSESDYPVLFWMPEEEEMTGWQGSLEDIDGPNVEPFKLLMQQTMVVSEDDPSWLFNELVAQNLIVGQWWMLSYLFGQYCAERSDVSPLPMIYRRATGETSKVELAMLVQFADGSACGIRTHVIES